MTLLELLKFREWLMGHLSSPNFNFSSSQPSKNDTILKLREVDAEIYRLGFKLEFKDEEFISTLKEINDNNKKQEGTGKVSRSRKDNSEDIKTPPKKYKAKNNDK